jgi:CelD/BcsL family acetyltransferase involved in cellulose biosynthesis
MLSVEKRRKAVQVKSVEGVYDVFGRDMQDSQPADRQAYQSLQRGLDLNISAFGRVWCRS